MGKRKLGNLEKSSASFEHGINFGFDYYFISEVWEGRRNLIRVCFFKARFKKGQIKFDLIVNTLWNDTIVIFKN